LLKVACSNLVSRALSPESTLLAVLEVLFSTLLAVLEVLFSTLGVLLQVPEVPCNGVIKK